MCAALQPVGTERVPLADAVGRVLAETVRADRDSPACDVSAMDGYAVRLDKLLADREATWPVTTEVITGKPAIDMPADENIVRIFTGGAVPRGADAVIKREDTHAPSPGSTKSPASPDTPGNSGTVRLRGSFVPKPGQHIRRRGENTAAGQTVLEPGVVIRAPQIAALATFGCAQVLVYRRVRLSILVTGNEVTPAPGSTSQKNSDPGSYSPGSPASSPLPLGGAGGGCPPTSLETPGEAQVRDSNGPTLAALVQNTPWCELVSSAHIKDTPAATTAAMRDALKCSDAVLTTGGVSKGDHDYVPDAVRAVGCRVIYHGLRMRPGKPNLGAVGPNGQALFGLPGNPVSAAVGAVVLAGPVLRLLSGQTQHEAHAPRIRPVHKETKKLPLWVYALSTLDDQGRSVLVDGRGSGDVAALARCNGFVEVPPEAQPCEDARRWFAWGW